MGGAKSLPLALAFLMDDRLSDQGIKIGIGYPDFLGYETIRHYCKCEKDIVFVELNSLSDEELKKNNFISVSPEYIYQETQEWYKYHD